MSTFGAVRGWIPGMEYINLLVAAGVPSTFTGGALWLGPDAIEGFSFQDVWNELVADGQTLVGTIVIEASNDPRANQLHDEQSLAQWTDITADITPTNPTAGAGGKMEMVSDVRFEYVRMRLTGLTGSGRFLNEFSGHGN